MKSLFITCLTLLFSASDSAGVEHCKLKTYEQTSIHSYLWQKHLPELTEFTYCFWFSGHARDLSREPQIFSFAVGVDFNSFVLGYNAHAWDLQLVRSLKSRLLSPLTTEDNYLWDERHRHCFTWQNNILKWYADFQFPGKMELYFEFFINNNLYPIKAGNAFIPLHDQDLYATASWNTDAEMMRGNIADMNMWNYAMSDDAISTMGCYAQGNIVNNASILVHGTMTTTRPSYQCLRSNKGSRFMAIETVVAIPDHVNLRLIAQHPTNSSRFIAATSVDTIIELDKEGRCETLIGLRETLNNYCPAKHGCNLNMDTMPNITQLFYHRFEASDKFYILTENQLYTFAYYTCYVSSAVVFPQPFAARYVYSNCTMPNSVHVVSNYDQSLHAIQVPVNQGSSQQIEENVSPFLSGYRLPISNHDCSLFWEVPVSLSLDDMLNFAVISSKLIYLNATTGKLSWYTSNEELNSMISDTKTAFDGRIDAITGTIGEQVIASSFEMNAVLFLYESENLNSISHTSFQVLSHPQMCVSAALKEVAEVLTIEGCMYRCVSDGGCVAFTFSRAGTCNTYNNNTVHNLLTRSSLFDCYVKSSAIEIENEIVVELNF